MDVIWVGQKKVHNLTNKFGHSNCLTNRFGQLFHKRMWAIKQITIMWQMSAKINYLIQEY